MKCKYINKNKKFLENGHIYEITIKKELKSYVYEVTIWRDLTTQTEIDKVIQYASEISIKQNWELNKIELED